MGQSKHPRGQFEVTHFRIGDEELAVIAIPKRAPRCLDSLTGAERDVATLVLEGRTNAQIAAARGASVHTVNNQVAALLRKLGVSARAELAALVGHGETG